MGAVVVMLIKLHASAIKFARFSRVNGFRRERVNESVSITNVHGKQLVAFSFTVDDLYLAEQRTYRIWCI